MRRTQILFLAAVLVLLAGMLPARTCNIRVVSDNRPDFTDTESFIRSASGAYSTTDEKCRAIWRWLTRCRRQTPHPELHGTPPHDPVMFFNDFGYSFCSDYAGLNCAIWSTMGLPVRFWDIALHTVSECFYDGRWHHFDNSMSCYYLLCDGKTVAGVEDVGKDGACEASHGKTEAGHVALVHMIGATSPYGYITGADTQRPVTKMGQYCFAPKALKHRTYYNNYELGHRYLLNLRRNESYTRYASARGETADFYLPLEEGKSPQKLGTFGNGEWVFEPVLTDANWLEEFDFAANVCETSEGLKAVDPSRPAVIIFRVDGANIITSALARFDLNEPRPNKTCAISVSTDLGHSWRELLKSSFYAGGPNEVALDGVRGTHQYLVRIELTGGAILSRLLVRTITQLNKLTLPVLDLGLNTIDVVSGDPTETVMLWPELQQNRFLETCLSSENIESGKAEEWHGCLWLAKPGTGNLVYAIETPGEMTELMYGGRFYNRVPKSSIAIEHSTDAGKTWTKAWELTDTGEPWDTVHFETVKLPAGVKRVLVRYTLTSPSAGRYEGCSVYSIRANATYKPANAKFEPLEVTYTWSEWNDKDAKWVDRSHTQLVTQPRQRYTISVGGDDLPRTNWIRVNLAGGAPGAQVGSDGVDLKAKPFARTRHVWGRNLAEGKKYTFSVPSGKNWNGGDPDMTKLTDQAIAPTYGGGTTYMDGPIWETGKNPEITLDLGQPQSIAAARIHVTGYPFDFYKGPFCEIEVLTSEDGQSFASQKKFPTRMRFKDVDGDFVMPECGRFESWTFPVVFEKPVKARYVRFKIENPKMVFDTSELMVYDSVKIENWNEPLAMPLDR